MGLGSSAGGFDTVRFPENLASEDVPNYIKFVPERIEYGSIQNYGNDFSSNINFGGGRGGLGINVNNPFSVIGRVIDGFVDRIASGSNNELNKSQGGFATVSFNVPSFENANNAKVGNIISGSLNIGALNIQLGTSQYPNTLTSEGCIALYMPPGLAMNLGVQVKEESLGAAGTLAAQTIREKGYTSASGIADAASAALPAVITDLTRSAFKSPFQVATGRVANPFTYAIFNGVSHRTFNYSFTLVAKNHQESKAIKRICDLFMYYMLPQKSYFEDFHFYEVPNQWSITYERLGNKIEYLEAPRKCFLKDVKIAYGPNTEMSLHSDGSPLDVKLDLTFLEIEPLHRSGSARQLDSSTAGFAPINAPAYDNGRGGAQ